MEVNRSSLDISFKTHVDSALIRTDPYSELILDFVLDAYTLPPLDEISRRIFANFFALFFSA